MSDDRTCISITIGEHRFKGFVWYCDKMEIFLIEKLDADGNQVARAEVQVPPFGMAKFLDELKELLQQAELT